MKKLLYFLFFIIGFGAVQAQPHLRVSSITGTPFSPLDTAYETNTYDSIQIAVMNMDTAVFTDSIQILIQANSQPVDTLYSDISPTTILPGDSVVLIKSGYVFLASHFDDGDNIIVVWPRAKHNPIQADSLTMHIYYVSLIADARKVENELLTIYPNPANNFISFHIPDGIMIKQVRISDSSGKEIYRNSVTDKFISTDNWSPGIYIIEAETTGGSILKYKIVKN